MTRCLSPLPCCDWSYNNRPFLHIDKNSVIPLKVVKVVRWSCGRSLVMMTVFISLLSLPQWHNLSLNIKLNCKPITGSSILELTGRPCVLVDLNHCSSSLFINTLWFFFCLLISCLNYVVMSSLIISVTQANVCFLLLQRKIRDYFISSCSPENIMFVCHFFLLLACITHFPTATCSQHCNNRTLWLDPCWMGFEQTSSVSRGDGSVCHSLVICMWLGFPTQSHPFRQNFLLYWACLVYLLQNVPTKVLCLYYSNYLMVLVLFKHVLFM